MNQLKHTLQTLTVFLWIHFVLSSSSVNVDELGAFVTRFPCAKVFAHVTNLEKDDFPSENVYTPTGHMWDVNWVYTTPLEAKGVDGKADTTMSPISLDGAECDCILRINPSILNDHTIRSQMMINSGWKYGAFQYWNCDGCHDTDIGNRDDKLCYKCDEIAKSNTLFYGGDKKVREQLVDGLPDSITSSVLEAFMLKHGTEEDRTGSGDTDDEWEDTDEDEEDDGYRRRSLLGMDWKEDGFWWSYDMYNGDEKSLMKALQECIRNRKHGYHGFMSQCEVLFRDAIPKKYITGCAKLSKDTNIHDQEKIQWKKPARCNARMLSMFSSPFSSSTRRLTRSNSI